MSTTIYPPQSREVENLRARLSAKPLGAFHAFSSEVFAVGALTGTVKQLIAVAVAHVTDCPYCIRGHTKAALRAGASPEQIMEAIWVAAEMRAGAAYAHSAIALDVIAGQPGSSPSEN